MSRPFSSNDLQEIDTFLQNHFVCKGYKNISKTFSQETSSSFLPESELDLRDSVRRLIEGGELCSAIDILNDYSVEVLADPQIRLALALHWAKEYIFSGMYENALEILNEEKEIDDETLTDLLISLVYQKKNDILSDRKNLFGVINSKILNMMHLKDSLDDLFDLCS